MPPRPAMTQDEHLMAAWLMEQLMEQPGSPDLVQALTSEDGKAMLRTIREFHKATASETTDEPPEQPQWTWVTARQCIRSYGMSISRERSGEYRVNWQGGREATAYYTTDLADAVGTAKAEWVRKHKPEALP